MRPFVGQAHRGDGWAGMEGRGRDEGFGAVPALLAVRVLVLPGPDIRRTWPG
jgi:hypothetical protein